MDGFAIRWRPHAAAPDKSLWVPSLLSTAAWWPLARRAGLEFHVAVDEMELDVVALAQLPGDPVRDSDRAVSATGAADGDRQVLFALRDIGGEQELEQRHQAAVELAGLGARLDVLADRLVEPGQRTQLVDVMRVRQETDVESEIRVERRAVLEAEGEDGECELILLGVPADQLGRDPAPEHATGQRRRVDHDVRALPQRGQPLALRPDPVDDPPAARQRMPAARLPVAMKQGLLIGLEEDHLEVEPAGGELVEDRKQVLEVLAASHVGDDRGLLDAAAGVAEELPQAADHPRRQVVHAEVAAVLEGGDRLRLTGPRVAGDHHEFDP